MTDPTREDAGPLVCTCPTIAEAQHHQRECPMYVRWATSHQSPITSHPDERYIRDVTAAKFGVEVRTDADAAALLEGEVYYCDLCGEKFPLWPIREWAAHYVHEHHDAITIQQQGAVAAFCVPTITPEVLQWIGLQLLQRVAVRRRARDLGMIRFAPNIVVPGRSN